MVDESLYQDVTCLGMVAVAPRWNVVQVGLVVVQSLGKFLCLALQVALCPSVSAFHIVLQTMYCSLS